MKLDLQLLQDEIGPDPSAPPATTETDLTEFDYANRLADKLPKIKTVGADWYACDGGTWRKLSRPSLRPIAQSILPPIMRTARREAALLDHLEGRFQVLGDSFRGFYRQAEDGAVLLNVANGVVRVTPCAAVLEPANESHLFTSRTESPYDPEAACPQFRQTLEQCLPDEADRHLFQLCCGNFLLPDCRFEVALVCYGEAGSGKSTVAEPISAALGNDLIARLTLSQVCDPRSYHLPKLRFVAVNLGTELDAIPLDESANFKTLVSGEPVEARPIYGEPFTMQTTAKLWFLANGLPRFKSGTEAELRRTRFLRFAYKPPVKDTTLKARLAAERDGVFAWMLEGLRLLMAAPEIPLGGAESQDVHERFRVSNDPLGAFVGRCCELDPDAQVSKEGLRESFADFCESQSLPVELGDFFFKRLLDRWTGLKEVRPRSDGQRVRVVTGIRLKANLP